MLTVYESSHSPFCNNASEANHWEIEIRCYNSLGSCLESNPGTLVERVCQHPLAKQSDGFVKLPHSLISFAFLLSSQNWRVRCSPKKAEFISSFINLGFYFGEKLTSGFPELLLIWGSGKAESMQQCLQAVQYVWKNHQCWSARGNHWDQSPVARAATLNLVAREQHVGCSLCKTGEKVEKSMWVTGVDSKTGEWFCSACSCLLFWALGFAQHWHCTMASSKASPAAPCPRLTHAEIRRSALGMGAAAVFKVCQRWEARNHHKRYKIFFFWTLQYKQRHENRKI